MVKITGSLAAILLVCSVAPAQTDAQKSSATSTAAIQDWKGTLVDANCAGGASASDSQAAKEGDTKTAGTPVDTGRPEKGHHKKGEAQAQSCPVSASTVAFALKTESGQVIKFDAIGNARAAEELKTKTAWTKHLSEGKPVRAKVSGILNGDKITVTSIG